MNPQSSWDMERALWPMGEPQRSMGKAGKGREREEGRERLVFGCFASKRAPRSGVPVHRSPPTPSHSGNPFRLSQQSPPPPTTGRRVAESQRPASVVFSSLLLPSSCLSLYSLPLSLSFLPPLPSLFLPPPSIAIASPLAG